MSKTLSKAEKELANICLKATLLDIAIKYRIDFFELMRSASIEEYNRACPLCHIEQFTYDVFKNLIKENYDGQ